MYVTCSIVSVHPLNKWLLVSDRRGGSSSSGARKDEYSWRYDADDNSEEVLQASTTLENIQWDHKSMNLPTSWR
jgi:FGFR1 oncogene partner